MDKPNFRPIGLKMANLSQKTAILTTNWPFLWDKLAILSPIGLKFGLSITLHSNDGQNKLEVCTYVSQKLWLKWPKMV